MQRLSLGSSAGKPRSSAASEEAEGANEKATKAVVRAAAGAPHKSIHLVPVLTLLCFLVLFLLSRDPSAALTDSPVLTATARSLEAAAMASGGAAAGASAASAGARGGVYRRLKEDHDRRPR